jgi:hypothetical protein
MASSKEVNVWTKNERSAKLSTSEAQRVTNPEGEVIHQRSTEGNKAKMELSTSGAQRITSPKGEVIQRVVARHLSRQAIIYNRRNGNGVIR